MSYKNIQDAYLEEMDLKAGDRVRIFRKAKDHEHGWNLSWTPSMDDMVGRSFRVSHVDGIDGIKVDTTYGYFWVPIFVVEKEEYQPKSFKLSSDYTAEVLLNGSVQVGCQNVPHELLAEIYKESLTQYKQTTNK